MRLHLTSSFKRDIRRARRRGKDLSKLWTIVAQLLAGGPVSPRNRPHRLSGEMSHLWECHVETDWLLTWEQDEEDLFLARTGTHSDLFE